MIVHSSIVLGIITLGSRKISAIALFPFIIVRGGIKDTNEYRFTINHERIHLRQQAELLIVFFYLWYLLDFALGLARGLTPRESYRSIIFEREAYGRMHNLDYLNRRQMFSFLKW